MTRTSRPKSAKTATRSLVAVAAAMASAVAYVPSASAATAAKAGEVPPKAKVAISETGSTLLYPLFQLWSTAYHKQYGNISITPEGTGSGTGISSAAQGTVDIGASDAYLSSTDRQQYKGLMNIALAISAQQVNYNVSGVPANRHIKLNGQILAAIYEGKITYWDDRAIQAVNKGLHLPHEQIVALHRSDSSGDTFLFTSYLSAQDPKGWGQSVGYGTSVSFPSISNALAAEGNGGMVSTCKQTPGCVAYIGISYLTDTQKAHLGEAYLENKSGQFVQPTAKSISAEAAALENKTPANESLSMIDDPAKGGYPIINYEYAIIPGKESNNNTAGAVKAFLNWAVEPNGGSSAKFLNQVRFVALPAAVAKLSMAQIAKISG
ncbi:MAG TPA: phosphate ABC transporter substrate-binding protein PstS [Acidimicrobiales bacterium]|nr:phosphate ABC transporter substrate-binding protein PstS [Acidimicrobiales bacterium]